MSSEYMPDEYRGKMYHYTSFNGMKSILFADKDIITLWASRFDCLNDISEGSIAEIIFREVCSDLYEEYEINEKLYSIFMSTEKVYELKLESGENNTTIIHPECDRYITSFSKNNDSLTMWNYYSKGNKYEGFNIGMSASRLNEILIENFIDFSIQTKIYPIIYKKREQKSLIRAFLLKIKELYKDEHEELIRFIILNQLDNWALIFKSEYFQHEEEVRVVIDIEKDSKRNQDVNIKYRYNCGYLIPYFELNLNKISLTSVTIGPLQCDDNQKEIQKNILLDMLQKGDYKALVHCSKVPVRF